MSTRIQVTAIMKLALAIALTVLLSQAAMAQVSLPFSDDFNRADENPVGAPYGSIGGGGYRLEGNELRGGGGGSAYVQFSPPAGSYSVSATTFRDLGSTPNHSIGVGFADAAAVPGGGSGAATGPHLVIDVGGNIFIWHNVFSQRLASMGNLNSIGIANDHQGALDLLLEVNGSDLRAEVQGVEVFNGAPAAAFDPIGYAGVYNSSTKPGATWDNFSLVPEPTSFALLSLGSLLMLWRRKRSRS